MEMNDSLCRVLTRRADGVAQIRGSAAYPDIRGTVLFYAVRGGVLVRAEITGLSKGGACESPIFAFHIHGGVCSGNAGDPFADAGMHYNPGNCPHPYHAGDLPPLFGANGNALLVCLTDRFGMDEIYGKTVIIHANPDDFTTQPSGNAGEKIACGVIQPTARRG